MTDTKIDTVDDIDKKRTNMRQEFISMFKSCLDILRDKEHLTGEKALCSIALLITYRLLNNQTDDLGLETYDYNFKEKGYDEEDKKLVVHLVKFNRLVEEGKKSDWTMCAKLEALWKCVLTVHPKTKDIFLGEFGAGFNIKHDTTYVKLIKKINDFDFESMEEDVLGEAYEEVVKDILVGKVLGQYFTPSNVKKIIIDLVDPQIKDDGTTETIFDPAMGTGGFLISAVRHFTKQAKEKDVKLDWDFISKKGVGGREAVLGTYQLACSNMLISSGHFFTSIEKGDSIRQSIDNKYDIILANPPFGISGLTYDEIDKEIQKSMPIKSNSSVPLFLQKIINILNIGGRCGVVLPDGRDLFGRNKELVALRKLLLKTCDLKEVIMLPKDTFTHTTILTCVMYFIKKKEPDEVLTVEEHKGNYKYDFVKKHKTKKVKFYELKKSDSCENVKTLLIEVSVDDIAENDYSLKYTEYLEKEDDKTYDDVDMMALGDVCDIKIGGTPSRHVGDYFGGNNLWVSVRELNNGYIFDTREKITDLGVSKSNVKLNKIGTILFSFKLSIGKIAIAGKPLYTNEAIAGINTLDEKKLTNKYLYCYLKNNNFNEYAVGLIGTGSLNKKSLENIKIPVPSLEKQEEIIKKCEESEKEIDEYKKKIKETDDKIKKLDSEKSFSSFMKHTKTK